MFSFLPSLRRMSFAATLVAIFGTVLGSAVAVTPAASAQSVQISPGSVDFGSQPQGSTGGAWTLTVNNTSGNAVTLGAITLSDGSDFVQSNNCPATLSAYTNCNVQVAFAPSHTGAITGQLLVPNSDLASPQGVVLAGNGTSSGTTGAPKPVLAPGSIDFGSQTLYAKSNTYTATLNNQGAAELDVTSIAVSDPADFSVTTDCGAVVGAYSSCHLNVVFMPSTVGTINASLLVKDNATGGVQSLALTGTGAAAATSVSLSPVAIDFGSQPTGIAGNAWTVSVNNSGANAISLSSLATSLPNVFQLSSTCGNTLAAHTSCNVLIAFDPTLAGPVDDQFTLLANGTPQSVPLHGNGVSTQAAQAAITFSPNSVDFGSLGVGSKSGTWTISVNNTTSVAATFSQVLTLAGSSAFVMSTDCLATMAPHTSCNMYVTFAPTANGPFTAQVSALLLGSTTPQIVTLTGTGIGTSPVVLISPNSVDFGSYDIGTTANSWTINVANGSGADINFNSPITVAGSKAFILSTNCGSTLPKYSTCNVQVSFAPNALGPLTGQLVVDVAGGSIQTATLKGNGTGTAPAPTVAFQPAMIDLGQVAVGQTATGSLTILNTGTVDATFTSPVTLSGSSTFTILKSTCATVLPAGTQCSMTVSFAPTDINAVTGEVVANFDSLSTPLTAALNGEGLAGPQVTIDPATYDFGKIAASVVHTKTLTVTNAGTVPASLGWTDFVINGTFTSGSVQTDTCQQTNLAPGASCSITFGFWSNDPTPVTGALTVYPDGGLPVSMTFTATAVKAVVSTNLNTLAFGDVQVGTTVSQSFTLTNTGTIAATLVDQGFGTNDYVENFSACPAQLAVKATCQVVVSYTPSQAGPSLDELDISIPEGGEQLAITTTGNGIVPSPTLILSPAAGLVFPATVIGTTSAPLTFTITNTSTVQAQPTGAFSPATKAFSVLSSTCPIYLQPAATCSVQIVYTAQTANDAASFLVTELISGKQISLPVSGTGTTPLPTIVVTPAAGMVFPGTGFGTTSAPQTMTVTNTSKIDAHLSISFYQPNSTAFAFGVNTCGTVLSAGKSCTVQVTYSPRTAADTALLNVTETISSVRTTLNLSGTGLPLSPLRVNPGSLNFGVFPIGATFIDQALDITNVGSVAAPLNIQLNDPNFAFDPEGCPAVMNPGQTCEIVVLFSPVQTGNITANIVLSQPNYAPLNVPITGVGPNMTTSDFSVSTNALVFPTTAVGQSSAAQTVTIKNITNHSVGFATFSNLYEFPNVGSTCNGGLNAGASCSFTMVFTPNITGPSQGFLRVSTNDGAQPAAVELLGTGGTGASNYTVTVNPTELTLASGQTGTALFTLTPTGGYKGTITLACAGLPVGVTCTFVPPTLTADGTNKVLTSTLTVSTTGINGASISLFALPSLLLLMFAATRKRFRKGLLPLAVVLLLAGMTSAMTGCGSGLSNAITPVGLTKVTVIATSAATGSSAAQTQTATFTLNITK